VILGSHATDVSVISSVFALSIIALRLNRLSFR
jgi:hypothetical protein